MPPVVVPLLFRPDGASFALSPMEETAENSGAMTSRATHSPAFDVTIMYTIPAMSMSDTIIPPAPEDDCARLRGRERIEPDFFLRLYSMCASSFCGDGTYVCLDGCGIYLIAKGEIFV